MQEEEIIFGGEKKLKQAIDEAYDDLPAQGDRDLLHLPGRPDRRRRPCGGPRDEGEAGHQRLRLQLRGLQGRQPVGRPPHRQQPVLQARRRPGRADGRGQVQDQHARRVQHRRRRVRDRRSLRTLRLHLVATFSGNASYEDMASSQQADLNLVQCHRSINYMAEMMETKYGIPWMKVNFIGAESTAKSLRKMAQYFGDAELIDRTEEVIAEELAKLDAGPGRGSRTLRGQAGDALRRRLARPPLPGPVHRHRHAGDLGRLRVRPPRRLRGPPGHPDDQGRRRQPQHRGARRRARPGALSDPARPRRKRHGWPRRACSWATTTA